MKSHMILALVLQMVATAALGEVDTTAEAAGDSIAITVTITSGVQYSGEYLVIRGRAIGSFAQGAPSSFELGPFTIDPEADTQTVVARVCPPELDKFYEVYSVVRSKPWGERRPTPPPCSRGVAYAACREAVATRGRLHHIDESCMFIEVCDPDFGNWQRCFPSGCAMEVRPEWAPYIDTGQFVDVYATEMYGSGTECTNWDTHCITVSKVVPLPDGTECVTLATESWKWGAVKALFR